MSSPSAENVLDPQSRDFYVDTLRILQDAGVEFLLGGAYAFARYTGIERHTKDLDVFVRPEHARLTLEVLGRAGYASELTFPHWLGKAHCGADFIDVIFSSGNGIGRVDDQWFEHASHGEVFGVPVRLVPPEEMIWHKAYVMERERFDGADVAHLLLARAEQMDWPRLLDRFGAHWRVLLSHLILFGFIYPGEQRRLPARILQDLLARVATESTVSSERVCRGTIISRGQYLPDIKEWGYQDARKTENFMNGQDIEHWTDAIGNIA